MDNANFAGMGQLFSMLRENPQMLQMLMSLMGSSAPKPEPKNDPFSTLMNMTGGASSSPAKPQTQSSPFGSSEEIKNRICLLGAVRPYLSEARRERLDTVLKLLRLAEVGELSSLLGKG